MRRPQPPRRIGSDGASPNAPDVIIAEARHALATADAEVARVSRDRLAALLGQSARQRFQFFDDPDLLPADRVRLRASVLEAEQGGGLLPSWLRGFVESAASQLLRRPRTVAAAIALCVGAPLALQALTVHDGDAAVVTRVTRVTVKNQDGRTATGALGPGVRLVVIEEGPSLQAREWIAGAGYRTYTVDARDAAVNHRSPWQILMAFAAAVHVGWTQPASRS